MNRHLGSRYRRLVLGALPLASIWAATLIAAVLLVVGFRLLGAVVAAVAVALLWSHRRSHGVAQSAPQAVITLALGLAAGEPIITWPVTAAVLLAAMAAERIDPHLRPRLEARRLPGYQPPAVARISLPVFQFGCAATLALTLSASGLVPSGWAGVLVGLILLTGAAVAGYQLLRNRHHLPEREIHAALDAFGPAYYVYFSGRPEGAYQVQMWLPYLERVGANGALLVRERSFLKSALELTEMPVLLSESVEPIEHTIVGSLGAIFYVNNASKNVDGTRYPQVAHVHLGHGDSDKPSSYALSTTMFDRIFVAGQAGADRFASHGVVTAPEKFVLVGRPQVADVEVRPVGVGLPGRPVVLYAPTWRGVIADMQLSSLASGEQVVRALLAAGATVIFRPHPFSARDAESRVLINRIDDLLHTDVAGGHRTSTQAQRLSLNECFNASEALVADVSSVVSDYLYSNKPIALAHNGTADQVLAEYPLAQAAYLLSLSGDLAAPLQDLLGADSKASQRAEVRRYYLGPWPPESYSEVFVDAARAVISWGHDGPRPQSAAVSA